MKEETKDAGGRGVGAGETWSSLGWGGAVICGTGLGVELRHQAGGRILTSG